MRVVLSVPMLAIVLLTACGDKPADTQSGAQDQLQVVAIEQACDDASMKNSLLSEVRGQLDVALFDVIAEYPDAKKASAERLAQSNLSMLGIDLQDVQVKQDACQAKLLLSLSKAQLSSADKYLKKQGENLNDLLAAANADYVDGYLAGDIHYSKVDDKVVLTEHPMLPLFARLMTMAQNTKMANSTHTTSGAESAPAEAIAQPVVTSRTDGNKEAKEGATKTSGNDAKTATSSDKRTVQAPAQPTIVSKYNSNTEFTDTTVTTKISIAKADGAKSSDKNTPSTKTDKNSTTDKNATPVSKTNNESLVILQTEETY